MKISLENPVGIDFDFLMRAKRNELLAQSDWTQVNDAPVDQETWATYRQALRDFPASWTAGPEADFPDTP